MSTPATPLTCGELSCDECNNRTAALTAELAAAKAERDLAITRAEVEKWQSVAVTMSAEREHNANEAGRLRAENERLKATLLSIEEDGTSEHNAAVGLRQNLVAAIARAERFEAEVERLNNHAFDKDGTPWKTVCGWWATKYDAVERNMTESATRAERAEAELKQMQSSALTWARFAAVKADGEDVAKQRAERAEADKARLDWLLDHGAQTHHSNPRAGGNYVQYHKERAAIDAAMSASGV